MKPRYSIRAARHYPRRKKRRTIARQNPSTQNVVFNKQGGIQPSTTFQLIKARAADLGTLPRGMCGTRCDLCKHYVKKSPHTGYCKHLLVQQMVSDRQCCIYFDCHGWLRPKKVAQ